MMPTVISSSSSVNPTASVGGAPACLNCDGAMDPTPKLHPAPLLVKVNRDEAGRRLHEPDSRIAL